MTSEPTEFRALLARARSGDEGCLEQLIRRTEDRLRTSVDRQLGTRLRAMLRRSDVLQNAYLAMLEALPSFRGATEDEFVAWVTRIIERDIHRQHRWFSAARRRAPSRTSERNALAAVLGNEPPTPSAEFTTKEVGHEVREALARLEPDHARVIELAMIQGLPHSQVAAEMRRTEGACRMLLMRARAALAIALERLEDEDR